MVAAGAGSAEQSGGRHDRVDDDRWQVEVGEADRVTHTLTPPSMTVFGYVYRDGAFVAEPGGDSEWLEDPEHPSGRPGTRAPHVVLARNGARLSTVDFLGTFVVFAGPRSEGCARATAEAAARFAVPVQCYRIGEDLQDVSGCFLDRYGIEPAGAVLVRPDGFIAWRSRTTVPRADVLAEALARVLCLEVGC